MYRNPFSPLCNTFDGRAFRVGNPSPVSFLSVANSLSTFIRKYYVTCTKRENESRLILIFTRYCASKVWNLLIIRRKNEKNYSE